jgi:hypothetical protein
MENIKRTAVEVFHKCPYFGIHEVAKVPLSRQFLMLFPNGEFKYEFSFSNRETRYLEATYEFSMT